MFTFLKPKIKMSVPYEFVSSRLLPTIRRGTPGTTRSGLTAQKRVYNKPSWLTREFLNEQTNKGRISVSGVVAQLWGFCHTFKVGIIGGIRNWLLGLTIKRK